MDPQQPLSVGYLDQIAPTKQNQFSKKTMIIFGIIAVIVVILAGYFALSTFNEPSSSRSDVLRYRLATVNNISQGAQDNLIGSDIRSTNATLMSFAKNSAQLYDAQDIKSKKPTKPEQAELDLQSNLNKTLEDARLNANYDRVYVREMTFQLNTILEALTYLQSTTSNQQQKAAYGDSAAELQIIIDEFNSISAAY